MSARTPVGRLVEIANYGPCERCGGWHFAGKCAVRRYDLARSPVTGMPYARPVVAEPERIEDFWVCEICGAENDGDACLFCTTAEEGAYDRALRLADEMDCWHEEEEAKAS